jgi:hypothetical protein
MPHDYNKGDKVADRLRGLKTGMMIAQAGDDRAGRELDDAFATETHF